MHTLLSLVVPRLRALSARAAAMTMLAVVLGCASTPPPAPLPNENALVAAGFKVVVAKSVLQEQHLQALPPGEITAMERNGTPFYVYPDPARNQIYVGTQKEFAAYQKLQPNTPDPQARVNAQAAAGNRAYVRRDATMALANQQAATDPYYFWPSFDALGW